MSEVAEPFTSCPAREIDLGRASLADPLIQAHPFEFYWALRHRDPVHYDERLGMWLVSRYEDVVAVLRDPETFSDKLGYEAQYASGYFEEFKAILEREGGGFFPDAIKSDPPYHTRVRKLLEKAFTAHRVRSLEPGITRVIVELIEAMAERAERGEAVDGVREFAIPLTIRVICEQLGIAHYNAEKISRWSEAVTAQIGRMQDREQMIENARQICELQHFLIAEIRDRQQHPKEDMISDLVHAVTEDGSRLTFEETVSLVRALIIAGNDTTATALGNLLFVLANQPELARRLAENAADDRFLTRFVEELLRYLPPVHGLAKMTTRETELGGARLPKHAHVLVLYASANDDETHFRCPRRFDLERENLGTHVAFGVGIHRCVGAPLARLEIKLAARELVSRLADFKLLVEPGEIRFKPTVATHTMESLPITFRRRAA